MRHRALYQIPRWLITEEERHPMSIYLSHYPLALSAAFTRYHGKSQGQPAQLFHSAKIASYLPLKS
jgi:hypothetical protein